MSRLKWSLVSAAFLLPGTAFGAVAINEVVFDPAGTDTGFEWVELYNNGDTDVDLSNWQVYPDGIGYYTIPSGTKLAAHAFLTIHLRAGGTNTATDLYHSAAGSNMGNSSGSIALFKAGDRNKDTIIAFMRYQKTGSTERKTWESTAADAGIWQSGTSVSIDSATEGNTLGLIVDGVTTGFSSAWKVFTTATIGISNTGVSLGASSTTAVPTGETAEDTSSHPEFSTAPVYVIPRLGAEIVADSYAAVGSDHRFIGRGYGTNKKLLDEASVRFLWNFGDGGVTEGPAVTHVFRFPGTYVVSLTVNSGAAIGTAVSTMTAGESGVRVSEVLAGPGGFVELANESSRLIDLTGWILKDGVRSFTLPEGTRIAAHTEAIFPNEITGLGSGALVSLYFGNMRLADSAPILDSSGALSSQRVGESWFLMSATPGIVTPASRAAVSKPTAAINPVRAEKVSPEVIEADPTLETAEVGRGAPPQRSWPLFLGISLFIGGLGAGGAVFTRRALS